MINYQLTMPKNRFISKHGQDAANFYIISSGQNETLKYGKRLLLHLTLLSITPSTKYKQLYAWASVIIEIKVENRDFSKGDLFFYTY